MHSILQLQIICFSQVPQEILPPDEVEQGIKTLRQQTDTNFAKTFQKFEVIFIFIDFSCQAGYKLEKLYAPVPMHRYFDIFIKGQILGGFCFTLQTVRALFKYK